MMIKKIKYCVECGDHKAMDWQSSYCEECFKDELRQKVKSD